MICLKTGKDRAEPGDSGRPAVGGGEGIAESGLIEAFDFIRTEDDLRHA
jgi:hypothetical protein